MTPIRPWVGEHYERGIHGRRLLLLGESSYHRSAQRDEDYSNIICENVQDCVFNGSVPFFTKVAKILAMSSGATAFSQDGVRDVWRHIAFTNYIQTVLYDARQEPTEADWATGRPVLTDQLATLRPDVLIILGSRLAGRVQWIAEASPSTTVAAIAHPSSYGFSYEKWVPTLEQAIHGRAAQAT